MQYLYPAFIFAGLTVAIPILIHLFNFRRYKKVLFSNVTFLKSLQQTSNSRRKLQQWLVLACRCLTIIFLVLAFMQPFFETKGKVKSGLNYTTIYLDNSQSMGLESSKTNLLNEGKERASMVIQGYGPDDRFKIVTNNSLTGNSQWLNSEEALSAIEEVQLSSERKTISQIVNRQKQSFEMVGQGKKNLYLISDFQKNMADLQKIVDTSFSTYIVPIDVSATNNVTIDTCFFSQSNPIPGQSNELVYTIKNYGNNEVTLKPIFKYNGIAKPLPVHTLKPAQSFSDTFPVVAQRAGYQTAELIINDAPVTFDDNYYMSWNISEKANILILNKEGVDPYLMAAIEASGLFEIKNEQASKVNFSQFGNYQLIVLNDLESVSSGMMSELIKQVENGVNLAIFPGAQAQSLMNQVSTSFGINVSGNIVQSIKQVSDINTADFVFQNVFEGKVKQLKLPITQTSYPVYVKNSRGAISLLTYRDGASFLTRIPKGSGNVFLCAAPLDTKHSDLVKNGEIIVPFLFKAALSTNKIEALSFTIGENQSFEMRTPETMSDASLKFKGPQTFIPEQLNREKKTIINSGSESVLPGIYSLEDKTGKSYGSFAFNYNRKESQMAFLSMDAIKQFENDYIRVINPTAQADLTSVVKEGDRGVPYWKYCLIAALLFLMTEALLLRFYK